MLKFFDEHNPLWKNICKWIIIAVFFGTVLFSFIASIGDATAEFLDIGMGGDDDGILDFLVWNIAGVTFAAISLAFNMLILQAVDNLRIIRENTEKR